MQTSIFNDNELRRLAARASTLYERLNGKDFVQAQAVDSKLSQKRLHDWVQSAANGDAAQFQAFMQWDAWDQAAIERAVAPVNLRPDAPLPHWVETLAAVLPADHYPLPANIKYPFVEAEAPLPFEEIFIPFVVYAQGQVRQKVGQSYNRLTEQAHATFERSLLGQLIDRAAQAIQTAFLAWKSNQQSSLSRLLARSQTKPGNTLYQSFVRYMWQGGLTNFFLEYAALARLLATMTELWVETQTEFVQRLDADWPDLEATFGNNQALGQVTKIQTDLSDPHMGRRTVVILTFASDVKLVYKPKSIGIEKAYNELLTWLNQPGCPLPLQALMVIDRQNYGWVEFATTQACENMEQVERHYQRSGMLLCLVYVLEGIDCHYENLVAHGEHPLLIDSETLMHHRPEVSVLGDAPTASAIAQNQMSNSVMRTALLPMWFFDANSKSGYDISGLGSHTSQTYTFEALRWLWVNTDQMSFQSTQMSRTIPMNHVPTLNGEPVQLVGWVAEIAKGFDLMYRFLLSKQNALLASDSPLYALKGQTVRFLFRTTNTYVKILHKLEQVAYLRDGVERSIALEMVKRGAAFTHEKPLLWAMINTERQHLEQYDVPFFQSLTDSDALKVSAGCFVEGFFMGSSFEAVLERIKTLSEANLKMQMQIIESSLYLRSTPTQQTVATHVTYAANDVNEQVISQEVLVAEAINIARRLQQRAIQAPDGSLAWLSPQFIEKQERFQFQPIGNGLYDGRLGIGLFLAGLARFTGEREFGDMALAAVQEFRQTLPRNLEERAQMSSHFTKRASLGLANGAGGQIYALTRMGQFLDDDNFKQEALELVHLVTPENIAEDTNLDVMGGAAGTLLGLVALYQVVPEPFVLEAALQCGEFLLAKSTLLENGTRAWKTLDERLLTGFSHGAAGIAYALLKLTGLTGQLAFRDAAVEAIAYEQSIFLPQAANWPDLRDFSNFMQKTGKASPPELMSGWCHGATGIGLARLGGATLYDNEAVQKDIEAALATSTYYLTQREGYVQQICCGSMSQVEFLTEAASRLGRADLLETARLNAFQIVRQAGQTGYILEAALPSSVYVPGFFRGEAGIGYTLLRLADPQKLPSVLLCE